MQSLPTVNLSFRTPQLSLYQGVYYRERDLDICIPKFIFHEKCVIFLQYVYVTGKMDLSGKTGNSVLPGLTRQNGSGTIFEAIYLSTSYLSNTDIGEKTD